MQKIYPLTNQELMFVVGVASVVFTVLDNRIKLPLKWSVGLTLTGLFIVIIFWSISKLWTAKDCRFKFIYSKNGHESYTDIINAKRNILVTHFSKNSPSEAYIALLLEKLDKEISITRILPKDVDTTTEEYAWLTQFDDKNHYIKIFADGKFFPFDVMIFDNKTVKVLFPQSGEHEHYKEGIQFDNPRVAAMFKAALEKVNKEG